MNWDAPGVTLLLKETVHSSWSSGNFSLTRNMHFLLSLMSKGTWMVRTSVCMLQLNVWCRASDARTQWSELSLLLTPQSVVGQAVRSSGKDRKLHYFRSEHFQWISHAVLTCHKSSFFNCSYVTKKIRFQGPTPNQFSQNRLYRAKPSSFFHVYNKQSRVSL